MILEIEKPSTLFDKIFIDSLKERRIILNEEISPTVVELVSMTINSINREDEKNGITIEDRKPIEVHVNSSGGSVYDGFAAVNGILTSKTPVHTFVTGYVMSMAFAIYIAGHKRFTYPYSNFMYHEISAGAFGRNVEIERVTKENKRLQKMYDTLVTSRTKIDQKRLDKVKKDSLDWFFDSNEAITLGVADEII